MGSSRQHLFNLGRNKIRFLNILGFNLLYNGNKMDHTGIAGHGGVVQSITDGMDYFTEPEIDASLSSFVERIYKPQNPITDEGPIYVEIGSSEFPLHTIMGSARVEGCVSVTKDNDEKLAADEQVSIVNTFPHALWEEIKTTVNHRPTNPHTRFYPYKAFLMTLLSYSSPWKSLNAVADYWFKDEYPKTTAVASHENKLVGAGVVNRMKAIELSNKFYFSFFPYLDIFSTDRYLPPKTTLGLEFFRSRDKFSLLAAAGNNTNYKINLHDFKIKIRHVTPEAKLNIELEKKFISSDSHLPFHRTTLKAYQMHAGKIDLSVPNLFSGTLPRHVLVAIVDNQSVSGSLKHNPFVFHHYGVDSYALINNGFSYPSEPVKINVAELDIVSGYKFFLDNIGVGHSDTDIDVSINDYYQGSFVMAFDLTPDLCNGAHRHAARSGVIDLKLYLENPLDDPVTLLVLATFDTQLALNNKLREIKLDYIL